MKNSIDKNLVSQTCNDFGLQLRKHIRKTYSWTSQCLTVVDLDEEEKQILRHEGEPVIPPPLCAVTALKAKQPFFLLQSALCRIGNSGALQTDNLFMKWTSGKMSAMLNPDWQLPAGLSPDAFTRNTY